MRGVDQQLTHGSGRRPLLELHPECGESSSPLGSSDHCAKGARNDDVSESLY